VWKIRRGDTLVFGVQVRRLPQPTFDSQLVYCARCPSGVAVDLTGWFLWCTVKRTVSDPDQLSTAQVTSMPTSFPAGGGITFPIRTAGQALVTVPALATRSFPDGTVRLVYDVQGQDPSSGGIFTFDDGDVIVRPDVTNTIGAYAGGGNWPPPVVGGGGDPVDVLVSTTGGVSAAAMQAGRAWKVVIKITASFSAGTTANVGSGASPTAIGSGFDMTQAPGVYPFDVLALWPTSALVLVTLVGAPTVGAAEFLVFGGAVQS
jgi:hypothetical protein